MRSHTLAIVMLSCHLSVSVAFAQQTPPSGKPTPSTSALQTFRLKYEGTPGKERSITTEDKEFRDRYVDWNIANTLADIDVEAGKVVKWEIRYKDVGRVKVFDESAFERIQLAQKPGDLRKGTVSFADYYELNKDGFIYPMFDGAARFDKVRTRNIVEMRSHLHVIAQALHDLRELQWLTLTFSNLVAANVKGLNRVNSIALGPTNPFEPTRWEKTLIELDKTLKDLRKLKQQQ